MVLIYLCFFNLIPWHLSVFFYLIPWQPSVGGDKEEFYRLNHVYLAQILKSTHKYSLWCLYIVTLYSAGTGALTCENWCLVPRTSTRPWMHLSSISISTLATGKKEIKKKTTRVKCPFPLLVKKKKKHCEVLMPRFL